MYTTCVFFFLYYKQPLFCFFILFYYFRDYSFCFIKRNGGKQPWLTIKGQVFERWIPCGHIALSNDLKKWFLTPWMEMVIQGLERDLSNVTFLCAKECHTRDQGNVGYKFTINMNIDEMTNGWDRHERYKFLLLKTH